MGESYIAIFVNSALAKGDPFGALAIMFLFLGRFLPVVALTSFFGARVMPHPVKLTFALSMFVLFLPKLLLVTNKPVTFDFMLLLLMIKELFIGILLGFMLNLPFTICQSAGIIIDHQRGGASLMVNDPVIQNQSSPLGTLFNFVMILLFWAVDGPFLVIDLINFSFEVVPPDEFFSSKFFLPHTPFWTLMVQLFNRFMILSIQLATPALLAILMTDVFLGIANRLAPQVQITFLGMPLKSLLALLVIWVGFKLFNDEITRQAISWLNTVGSMIQMFTPEAFG